MINKNKKEIRRNEEGMRVPKSSDSYTYILGYLMSYCLCLGDKDYNRLAVDSLLRRLARFKKSDVDQLIEALTSRGATPTRCITVPRTMDGRFQVGSKKGYPHLVYTRIWRWGDLQPYQITHISSCKYGFDLKRSHICVNPYHYKKLAGVEETFSSKNFGSRNEAPRTNEACSQNIADDVRQKNQDMPEQQQQESQDTYEPNEKLIPLIAEHQISDTEYDKPQEPAHGNNNIESTIQPGSINNRRYSNNLYNVFQPVMESSNKHSDVQVPQSQANNNAPLHLQNGVHQNENNFMEVDRNVETPAVSLSMCEQVLLDQSDFQGLTISNDQRQNNFHQTMNLPAPSCASIANNLPLIPNCSQQSQDLVQSSNVRSVHINEMPPPSKIPISRTSRCNFRPLPCSTPLLNNKVSLPCSTPLPNNEVSLPCSTPLPTNGVPLPCSTPIPNNGVPLLRSSPILNNLVPMRCRTPMPIYFEDFGPTEEEQNEQLTSCNEELQNQDTTLNCTIGRILKENNSQPGMNPAENTLNETLDQILSQVQNNNPEPSNMDPKFKNHNLLLDYNYEQIAAQSNIEQFSRSNKESPSNDVPIVVDNEVMEQNNNQPLQAINNVFHHSQKSKAVSPLNDIASLSPVSSISSPSSVDSMMSISPIKNTIKPLSPLRNSQPSPRQFPCENSTLLLIDNNNKNTMGENNKNSKNKFLHNTLREANNINDNAQQNASQYFNESMISFINNNITDQTRMSTVSKCEQYLLNQSNIRNAPMRLQPLTNSNNNSNNNPDACEEENNLQALQNNAQQIHTSMPSQDKDRKHLNMNEFFNIPNRRRANDPILFNNAPLEHWCSIDYFELDNQVGDTFKVKNEYTTIDVDGYLDPDSGNRFCLGRLTNVNRTAQSERTRMHIAQGIALELRKDGDIWLRCKSKNSVFVQAHFLDLNSDRHNRHSVHKIFPGTYKKVFDLQRCYKHIKAQIATAQAALKAKQMSLAPAVSVYPKDLGAMGEMGVNVDDLRRFCILRISFVKGWGSDYPRDTIKETPCWIEVHISRALQILDQFLLLDKPIIRGMD